MKNKFGVIVSYNRGGATKNIGDYMQTLAAIQKSDSSDYVLVDRENLDEFSYENNKKVNVIMNGWFMANPHKFPPSDNINPLYVSFHLTPPIEDVFFTKETIEHLKQYQPIGCRDTNTVALMKKHGIDAYFSGCLTLTLNANSEDIVDLNKRTNIYIVDPYIGRVVDLNIIQTLKRIYKLGYSIFTEFSNIKKISERIKLTTFQYNNLCSRFLYAAKIFTIYNDVVDIELLKKAEYVEHIVPMSFFHSESDKLEYTKNLLQKYANAKFVLTSRIHCALPCLAVETPVIFVSSGEMERKNRPTRSPGRLQGLKELFRNISVENYKAYLVAEDFGLQKKVTSDIMFENKSDYKSLRERLIQQCQKFLD